MQLGRSSPLSTVPVPQADAVSMMAPPLLTMALLLLRATLLFVPPLAIGRTPVTAAVRLTLLQVFDEQLIVTPDRLLTQLGDAAPLAW